MSALTQGRYQATPEAVARILILIDGFSRDRRGQARHLEGRTKMAKLDFLLRYPMYLTRALEESDLDVQIDVTDPISPIEARMIRYRYGPWDPAYFAVLGSLIGRGLIESNPLKQGFGYRTTASGEQLSRQLEDDESFQDITQRVAVLRNHFDWSGNKLKNYIYELFPEVTNASWTENLS